MAVNVTNSSNQTSGISANSAKNLCDETSLAIKEENLDVDLVGIEKYYN